MIETSLYVHDLVNKVKKKIFTIIFDIQFFARLFRRKQVHDFCFLIDNLLHSLAPVHALNLENFYFGVFARVFSENIRPTFR